MKTLIKRKKKSKARKAKARKAKGSTKLPAGLENLTCGEMIRACRKAAGFTMQSLAHAVGVVESAVQAWEKDWSRPSSENIPKIAKAISDKGVALPATALAARTMEALPSKK